MRTLTLPLAALLAAAPAGAQLVSPEPAVLPAAAPAPAAPVAVGPFADAAVGLRPAAPAFDAAAEARAAAPRRRGYGRDIALMSVGGAAIVLGLLAGDAAGGVLIVGGAVIGGVGLYNFLR